MLYKHGWLENRTTVFLVWVEYVCHRDQGIEQVRSRSYCAVTITFLELERNAGEDLRIFNNVVVVNGYFVKWSAWIVSRQLYN